MSQAGMTRTAWIVVYASVLALVVGAAGCAGEPEPEPDAPAETGADARPVEVAVTVAFTEGPTVDADGSVYFTDIGNNRIVRMSPDGELSTFRQPGTGPTG